MINSGAFGTLENFKDVDGFISEAASAFKDSRAAAWSYFLLRDPVQARLIEAGADAVVRQLNYARSAAASQAVKADIDMLAAIVPEFTVVLNKAIDAINIQDRLQRDQANPAETAAQELLTEATLAANQLANLATVDAADATVQATRTRLLVGLIVVVLLIGSAVFATLAIGGPIRRIGEVLVALANGNKAMDIPYVDRGDEVGDNARAAKPSRTA